MESLFNYQCFKIGYAELSEESGSFQEIPAPKKVPLLKKQLFGKSTWFEKVHILNNCLLWRKSYPETVAVLKKYLYSRSSCLEKVFVTKN